MDSLSGMVRFIRWVLKGTFIVEGIGAVFYALQFVPEYGLVRGIWYSVFHAVSAFCNAGVEYFRGQQSYSICIESDCQFYYNGVDRV